MSSGQMRFFSTALGRMVRFNVLIPNGRGPYPVLYLLHGRGDDCDGWLRHTNIELLFAAHRLIVVMPEAATSYYLNTPGPAGERYEDFLLEDLLPYVERTFPAVADRNGRALAGLSM
ncbi:MAG: alpha/beta hydrolase, partial [Phycisphaerae bacterium]